MLRISEYIAKENPSRVIVTLDTHNVFDIAHKSWWKNEKGEKPSDFTLITVDDIKNGVWKAANPDFQKHAEFYVKKLAEQNKYELRIWPDHCIDGTEGHKINPELKQSLSEWETKNNTKVEFVLKGMNHKTEHYSALKAEVVLDDEDTKLRTDVINGLVDYKVTITGEASSHCVAGTTLDLLENMDKLMRENVIILKNCMSPVPGFESNADAFFVKVEELGAKVIDWNPSKKLKLN